MSITDELRHEVAEYPFRDNRDFALFDDVADRIDREYRMALEKVAAEADALPMTDENMAEHGWVRLPVDADGVPIHVGDRLTDGEYTFTAYELAVYGDGSWSIRNEDGIAWAACDVTHCASTVEGVLQEFAERVCNSGHKWGLDAAGTIAEFAARLRLAEEVDE